MPTTEALIAFTLATIVFVVVPGPSVLFVIGRSLSYGRRGGFLSVLGNGLGSLPLAVLVAFGVGSIVAKSVVLFTIIKLLGAAYLIYLGVQAIRHRNDAATEDETSAGRAPLTPVTMLRQGFVVGVTNPKTIVYFIAVLPQFVNFSAGSLHLQMLLLGLLSVLIGLVFDSLWALLAGSAQIWFARSPRRLAGIRATGGGLMITLGGLLAFASNKA